MIGFADLFARRTVAVSSALTSSVIVQVTAIFAALLCVAGFGGTFTSGDLAVGLASGAMLGAGFGLYYGGIARSSATIVSPLVAAISAIIPFGYTVVRGADPTLFALLGSVVAIAGIVVMTMGGGPPGHLRTGIVWGTTSGVAYGLAFAMVISASDDAGSWPAVWQRVAAALTLGLAASRTGAPLFPPASVRFNAALAGVCSALCTVFYLVGVRADPTAAVITASMFPAASVAVGRIFFQDTVTRIQGIGIVVVLAGVVGVVAG